MALAAYAFLLTGALKFSVVLLAASWIVITISIFKHKFFEKKLRKHQIIGNGLISLFIGIVFCFVWIWMQPQPTPTLKAAEQPKPIEQKLFAYLVPDTALSPISACGIPPPAAITIYYGSDAGYTSGNNLKLISVDNTPLISAKRTSSGLLMSLKLFDNKGKVIANIVDNKFVGKLADNLAVNNTEHTLDIFDKNDDRLIFHFRYLNPKAMEILGVFYHPTKKLPLVIDENRALFPNGAEFSNYCSGGVGEATLINF